MHRRRPDRAKGKFLCTLCGAETQIEFRIPRFMQNEFVGVTCSGCESRFQLKLRRLDGRHKDQYHQWISCTFKSQKALDIEVKKKAEKIPKVNKNPYDKMSL